MSVSSLFAGHKTKGYMAETCTFLAFFPTQLPKPGFTLSWKVQAQTPQGEWRALRRQGQELALRSACSGQLPGAGRCDTGGWSRSIFLWCHRWSQLGPLRALQELLHPIPVRSLVLGKLGLSWPTWLCMKGTAKLVNDALVSDLLQLCHPWLPFLYPTSLCIKQGFLGELTPSSWHLSASGCRNLISCWESET